MSQIFVIGASGYVGRNLTRHFTQQGHDVLGLARSANASSVVQAAGGRPVQGDLEADLASVVVTARSSDVTVYAAQVPFDREPGVLQALCEGLAGSTGTFVFLSGSGVFMQRTQGAWSADSFAEEDPFVPEPLALPRVQAEAIVRQSAQRGLRAMVIRPPVIWGPGDNGPVANVYRSIAQTGAACYIESGLAAYSNVHSADLASLFSLAIERGTAGALYHAAAGEIPFRWIAEAVAHDMGVPARSLSMAQATEVFGQFGALIQSSSSRVRDPKTRMELGWAPTQFDLLSQVGEPRLRALASKNVN